MGAKRYHALSSSTGLNSDVTDFAELLRGSPRSALPQYKTVTELKKAMNTSRCHITVAKLICDNRSRGLTAYGCVAKTIPHHAISQCMAADFSEEVLVASWKQIKTRLEDTLDPFGNLETQIAGLLDHLPNWLMQYAHIEKLRIETAKAIADSHPASRKRPRQDDSEEALPSARRTKTSTTTRNVYIHASAFQKAIGDNDQVDSKSISEFLVKHENLDKELLDKAIVRYRQGRICFSHLQKDKCGRTGCTFEHFSPADKKTFLPLHRLMQELSRLKKTVTV
jgi:hypothetical protein